MPDPDTPPPTLAFESTAWAACGFAACILRSQHRQASDGDDGDFVRALSELRLGVVSAKALEVLSRARTPPPADCIRPTVLSPYRTRVQQTNDFEFRKLPGACAIYTAADSGDNPEAVEKAGGSLSVKTAEAVLIALAIVTAAAGKKAAAVSNWVIQSLNFWPKKCL